MRIITGKNKGRRLVTLPGLHTRPMMDRMKESVFNIIGPFFLGGIVLDLFGGSGALSLEALSRGCDVSYIVEMGKAAIKVIETNVKNLGEEDRVKIFKCDYKIAINKLKNDNLKFDLVFLDPPYKLNVIAPVINALLDNDLLNPDAYIICHYRKYDYLPHEIAGLALLKTYGYSLSEVSIYQKQTK